MAQVSKSRNASSPKYVTLEGVMVPWQFAFGLCGQCGHSISRFCRFCRYLEVYRSTKQNPSQRKYVMLEGVMMVSWPDQMK